MADATTSGGVNDVACNDVKILRYIFSGIRSLWDMLFDPYAHQQRRDQKAEEAKRSEN